MILLVDDEERVRRAAARVFAGCPHRLMIAADGYEALDLLAEQEVAVVVTDNQMPGIMGIDLLGMIAEDHPDTANILVTAYGDLPTVMESLNREHVFRFILKPWGNRELLAAVEQGMQRYRLIRAMKREDEDALRAIGQMIELKDPHTKGHCDRVAGYAAAISESLGLSAEAARNITLGSWLHDCGKTGVPDAILNFRGPVTPTEFDIIKRHPEWGADLARKANMPDSVIGTILHHHERFDGKGYPQGLAGADIPLEARIVAAADVFDALTTDRPFRKAYSWEKAITMIATMKGTALDPDVVGILIQHVTTSGERHS